MRVTSKGQVTIPIDIRRKLNITPGTEVDFVVDEDDHVHLVKKENGPVGDRFARLRGVATVNMTTEEIMALTRSDS